MRSARAIAALGLSAMALLSVTQAWAETFVVTKTADENGACLPGDCALREAILAANANPGADVITLPAGRFVLTIPGRDEDEGLTGDLDVEGDISIFGAGADRTIIDAAGIDRVFFLYMIIPATATALIEDLTVTGGAVLDSLGGGFFLSRTNTTWRRCVITGNQAAIGGGIRLSNASGSLIDSVVSNNTAVEYGGGLAKIFGGFTPNGLQIINSTISGNSTFRGGGIFFENFGTLELTNATVANNEAVLGSAIAFDSAFTDATRYRNSLIAGTCFFFQSGLPASEGGNYQSPGGGCGLTHPDDHINVPDLLLGPLADNGGPTPTHALLPGSLAIDGGIATCEATDQRGLARPIDGDEDGVARCDAGAFEAQPITVAIEIPAADGRALAALALLLAFVGWRRARG